MVHTGQNRDSNVSQVVFNENIASLSYHLANASKKQPARELLETEWHNDFERAHTGISRPLMCAIALGDYRR